MRRRGRRITQRFAATAPPGRHHDGGGLGLMLYVKPSGARSWVQRVMIGGRRRELGLGPFPAVSIAEARARAAANRKRIAGGEGAELLRETGGARLTFAEAAARCLEKRLKGLRNEKHRRQWRATLEAYAFPVLGNMPVGAIGLRDVLRVLEPLWETRPETASRLRGRVEAVLSWATVAGYREGDNPARWRGNLSEILPAVSAMKRQAGGGHHPALALADAPRWWRALGEAAGTGVPGLRFLALTAARSGEVRGARWEELDLEAGLWRIPAERMKAGREHAVPLSRAALALLAGLPRIEGEGLVFPGQRRGRPMSGMALARAMKAAHARDLAAGGPGFLDPRTGRPAVPHGLRSSFRDWATERGYERDLAEIALAHEVGSAVERAYRRTDMVERRRAMMEAWAAFLEGREAGGKVIPLAR